MYDLNHLENAKKLAFSVVQVINDQTEPERHLCAKLSLSKLLDAKMFFYL